MILADEIRLFVYNNYVSPARKKGLNQITVRAGEIHTQMGLSQRLPAVCSALGTKKIETEFNISRIEIKGPVNGSNTFFTYKV
ncbi:MAG: hypothetical protein Q8O47_07425 [Candidatus Bathyarchaeota archaeon]|nr:hypothetical protein [Candidatus Bathyarchaeota archaeon]